MRPAARCLAALLLVIALPSAVLAVSPDEIRRILRDNALRPPSEAALAALDGGLLEQGLREIDAYARLFPPRDYTPPAEGGKPRIGIGAELLVRKGRFLLSILPTGPADRAGVPDRSHLLAVDGQAVEGLDENAVAALFRGDTGKIVRLKVVTPQGRTEEFRVPREMFRPLDVEEVRSGGQRVLRIRRFTAGMTRPALQASLEIAARGRVDTASDPSLLVIDLRDAGGGDLYEAFDMAGMFLPPGTPLGAMSGRHGERREFRAAQGRKFVMPLALLIGPDTASAAEVFAGILRSHNRAVLVGQRSFGKCSSQTDVRLSDGSVLRYTNAEVLLPDGSSCTGQGLAPDREVTGASFDDLSALVEQTRALRAGR